MFLFITVSRIAYPYELEWLEGNILLHVKRILAGEKVYIKPSIEHMQLIYPPLYYYVAAGVSKVFGASFASIRAVSLVSTGVIAALIYQLTLNETKQRFYAVLALGIFFGAFRAAGAWFDLARVDMLFHALVLSLFYIVKFAPTNWKSVLGAAFIFFLIAITKQSALLVGIAFACLYIAKHKYYALLFVVASAIQITIFNYYFDLLHSGWYRYTIVNLVQAHTVEQSMILKFWTGDVILGAGATFALTGITFLLIGTRKISLGKRTDLEYILFLGLMMALSYGGRLFKGGYTNALISMHLGISLIVPIYMPKILSKIQNLNITNKNKSLALLLPWIFLIAQFYLFAYNPLKQIPTKKDRDAGNFIVNKIKGFDSDVWVPSHGYLADKAGKKPYVQMSSLIEIGGLLGKGEVIDENGHDLIQEIQQKIKKQEFDALMLDYDINWIMPAEELSKYYKNTSAIFDAKPGYVFFPVTGFETRPMSLYLPTKDIQHEF